MTIGPILIAYDGSANTRTAIERLATEGAAIADKAGLTAGPRVAFTMATSVEAIVQPAEKSDASLIVLGSHGRRGFRAALIVPASEPEGQ